MTLNDFTDNSACKLCSNTCVFVYHDKIIPGCRLFKNILLEPVKKCNYVNQTFNTESICRNCEYINKELDSNTFYCNQDKNTHKILDKGCEHFKYDITKVI